MDRGHQLTEEMLSDMEWRIAQEYAQAEREVAFKASEYMSGFQLRDEKWQQWVKDGKKTQQEYNNWRMNQMAVGQRWNNMRLTLAEDFHNCNNLARSTISGYMPDVYALNHNYATYQVETGMGIDTSYTLYDRQTVERLMRDDPQMLPPPGKRVSERIKAGQDVLWNQKQIQSVMMQGILQGESIHEIANRLANTVGEKNKNAAIRNARTMTTGAECAGRVDGYKRAQDMGIDLKQEWMATLDGRTRHSHRQMDGVKVEVGEKFPNGCRFPGDPTARAEEVYNCRCTIVAAIAGFDSDLWDVRNKDKLNGMTYDEWKNAKAPKKTDAKPNTPVSNVPLDTFKNVYGVTEEFKQGMAEALAKSAVPQAQEVFKKYADNLVCMDGNRKGGAFFSTWKGGDSGVHMNLKKVAEGNHYKEPYQTAFHEFGHMIDWIGGGRDSWRYLSNSPVDGKTLLGTIRSDFQAFKKSVGASRAAQVIPILQAENMDLKTCGNISDILEKCTGQSYPLGIGHGVSYHKDAGATEREFFAEVLDSSVTNPAAYAQMRRLFPNAVDMVWTMIGGIL